jgi:predicted nucleotidyltransferase
VTERESTLKLIREVCRQDERIVFAYAYGSFTRGISFSDIDIGIHVKETEENPFTTTSDIKMALSHVARKRGLNFTADQFDVKIVNPPLLS